MELRDLEYFAALAAHGNVRRAAEAVDRTAPALSKSLRRLEDEIGASLFERTPKGVELTPVGDVILRRLDRMRLAFEDVVREAREVGRGMSGNLRIGAGPTDAERLPELCATLAGEAPRLTFEVTVSDNDVLVPMLRDGKLDLIVNTVPEVTPLHLQREVLFHDMYEVFVAAKHPLARRSHVPIDALRDEGWVLSPASHRPNELLRQAFDAAGLPPPRGVFLARELSLRLETVARTRLLAYGPRSSFGPAVQRGRLRALNVKALALPRTVGVLYRSDAYLLPSARRLIDMLKRSG